jgi:hypothetical protein
MIAAAVLGILAVACFLLQLAAFSETTTVRETALFNTLQFLLTVGFTWFSTRAVSRAEFEGSLKRFAIGAYRRITDIDQMVMRLQRRIASLRQSRPSETGADLEIVGSVVEEMRQVVRSSIADWADVIGDEINTFETVRQLEASKQDLAVAGDRELQHPDVVEKARALEQRIEEMVSRLPPALQYEARRPEADELKEEFAADWLREQHHEHDGLTLKVIAGGAWICERDPMSLTRDESLSIAPSIEEMWSLDIQDAEHTRIGRVLNPTPLPYDGFSRALRRAYGNTELISVRFEKIIGEEVRKGIPIRWYRVRVLAEPQSQQAS